MSNTTGKDLIEHWEWAAKRGIMNPNTAYALKSVSLTVLGAISDDWENMDIANLDVEDAVNRFENLRRDFKPETLSVYKRRFQQSVKSFLERTKNPSGWKPPSQNRPVKRKPKARLNENAAPPGNTPPPFSGEGLVVYPYPLRENLLVYLHLPPDLKTTEIKRLTAFMTTFAKDSELNE